MAWLDDPNVDRSDADREWADIVEPLRTHGADLRRLRVVSEPWSTYVRYEFVVTPGIIAAGERVRWLPRDQASDLRLPGNDFWMIDDHLVFNLTAGDGAWLGTQGNDDPEVLAFCLESFEAAWSRAVEHEQYRAA